MDFNQIFDVIVIGGGPAGYHFANIMAKAGKSIALFEEKSLGGTCLNEGCIPSKTFLKSAKIASGVSHSIEYGVDAKINCVEQERVVERKNRVVDKLVMGVRGGLRKNKVKLFFSHAQIIKSDCELQAVECDGKIYGCSNLIIATGSKVFIPQIEGLTNAMENQFVLTSSNVFDLSILPNHLIVIGGGVIGIEMASYFAVMGAKVTVIEGTDKIGGALDGESAQVLQKCLTVKGIDFKLNSFVTKITTNGVEYKTQGVVESLNCDKILLSVGRIANVNGFGLENLSVEYTGKGIVVNDKMQTNISGVYAIGDVNGKVMLAHTAYKEAEVCANTILNKEDKIDYDNIPSIIYSSPECAWVGVVEDEIASTKGYIIKKLPMIYSGRFVAENAELDGSCKLVIDPKNNVLVGASLIGDGVSELIFLISTFIELKTPIDKICKLIFPHPTLGEIIKEVLSN